MYNSQKGKRLFRKRAGITLFTIAFLIGLAAMAYVFIQYFNPFVNQSVHLNQPGVANSVNAKDYTTVHKTVNDMYAGQLILVNNQVECKFLERNKLKKLYDSKTSDYKISSKETLLNSDIIQPLNIMLADFKKNTNFNDLLVASCYRSKELQTEIMNNTIQKSGVDEAARFVAVPGYSEHHTGYAIDFSIYTDAGISLDYTGDGKCKWLNQNCYRYGFVVRYDVAKQALTGIANEPWHFRYVGKPHAYVMRQKNFCLEEYLDYLKPYSYEKQHLKITDDENKSYEIYFVKAQSGGTSVPVPQKGQYTVSGNNMDGFIVTVTR